MRGWRRTLAAVCCLASVAGAELAAATAAAQDGPLHDLIGAPKALVIRGNLRSRTEAIDGQFRPGIAQKDFLQSFRTDIFAEYDGGPFRVGAEFRDARGYLQNERSSANVGEVDTFEPLQAYVAAELDGLVGGAKSKGTLTAGRFTLDVGAQRFVGRPDFPNSVNTFTGLALDWRSPAKDRLVAFWTMPSTRLPNDAKGIRSDAFRLDRARGAIQFWGASYQRASLAGRVGSESYLYFLGERDSPEQATRDRHVYAYGLRLFATPAPGRFDFEVDGARESGHARLTSAATDRTDVPLEAYLVHGEVGRKFAGGWTPRVSLHGDYISGDDPDPRKITRFDGLYGAARVDFGPPSLYGAIARANLVSGGVRVDVAPTKRLDGFVMAREFWLADRTDAFAGTGVRDRTGRSGSYAGTQVEGRVRYWLIPKRLRIEGGGAILAKGRFLREAPNAPRTGDTHYGYFDIVTEF